MDLGGSQRAERALPSMAAAETEPPQPSNPRKADLQRWRETFAEKLRGWASMPKRQAST
jgi:hypothetical protein